MKKNSENSVRNKIDGFEEYSLRRKKRAIWTAAGCVIAALMVVGISFALRSQGRALDETQLQNQALNCNLPDHKHDNSCYLICGMVENAHTHGDSCYSDVPTCKAAEHEHTRGEDGCYELKCTEKPHTHVDECYDKSDQQTGKEEKHDETDGDKKG